MKFKFKMPRYYFIKSAIEIFSILSSNRKFQIGLLFLSMLMNSISEIFLLGSVIPFISIISNPNKFLDDPFIKNYFNFSDSLEFSVILKQFLFIFVFVVLIATVIKIINIWLIEKVSAKIGSDLSCQLYKRAIYSSYQSHLNQNSSKLISNLTVQIDRTIKACKSFFKMCTSLIVGTVILFTLIYVDKNIALSILLILSITYFLIGYLVSNQIKANSKDIYLSSKARIKVLQESLGGIRDIILSSRQKLFINFFRKKDITFFDLQANNSFLSRFPRALLQGVSLILISLLTAFFTLKREQNGSIIALLGAFAIGIQRMVPHFQQVYLSWAKLGDFSEDIKVVVLSIKQPIEITKKPSEKLLKFEKISLINVYFKYSNDQDYVLKKINLEIKKGQKIGFIGTTGSGKSTTIDIIMGLLRPNKGKVLINNQDIFDKKNEQLLINWRRSIAHVPQNIFLADSSIAENIAFGEKVNHINMEKIEIACKKVHIHYFIKKLLQGYNSFVGERGVQLSGGQLQRLGIARALYRDTRILVFDEATSALDVKTEQEIINNINDISEEKLLIMISHRYSTLKNCDYIFKIDNGSLIEEGVPSKMLGN